MRGHRIAATIGTLVDWEQGVAMAHLGAALTALLAGLGVLLTPKGTPTHRAVGTAYVVALALVNAAALSLHREAAFGVFHALAIASLLTIAAGLAPLLLGKRTPGVIGAHAFCMTWSYVGLVAAGCGQLTVTVGEDLGAWVVPAVIVTALTAGGVGIVGRVPSTVDRTLAGRRRSAR
jgi:uncharacterized membrane protein